MAGISIEASSGSTGEDPPGEVGEVAAAANRKREEGATMAGMSIGASAGSAGEDPWIEGTGGTLKRILRRTVVRAEELMCDSVC